MTKVRDPERVFNILEKHVSCKKKHYYVKLRIMHSEVIFTVVLLRELTFPTLEYVKNRCLAAEEFIFPADLIKSHAYTCFIYGKIQDMDIVDFNLG